MNAPKGSDYCVGITQRVEQVNRGALKQKTRKGVTLTNRYMN